MAYALKTFPIYFDTTELFHPEKWEESFEKVQNVFQSEAGTDIVANVRTGKLHVSAEFRCTDTALATFLGFDAAGSFTLKSYDTATSAYKTRTVRMANLKSTVEIHSDYVTASTGLYTVTFDLIEF